MAGKFPGRATVSVWQVGAPRGWLGGWVDRLHRKQCTSYFTKSPKANLLLPTGKIRPTMVKFCMLFFNCKPWKDMFFCGRGEHPRNLLLPIVIFITFFFQVNMESTGGNDCIEETNWMYSRFSCYYTSPNWKCTPARSDKPEYIDYLCPRSYENFGTSGSKKSCFVSEVQPFKVGIAVRPNFT